MPNCPLTRIMVALGGLISLCETGCEALTIHP
jgi:hypothetical protein